MLTLYFVKVTAAASASTSAPRCIPSFPNEITEKIIHGLKEKSDLKAIRRAIPRTNFIVIPLLYDRIRLSLSRDSLHNAEQIMIHHPLHVETISISLCIKKFISRQEYTRRVNHTYEDKEILEWEDHLRKGYDNYVDETNNMRRALVSQTLGSLLGRALRELPHVRRVVLDAIPPKTKFTPARLKSVGILLLALVT